MAQASATPDYSRFHQLFAGAQQGREQSALVQAEQLYAASPQSIETMQMSPQQFIQHPATRDRMNQLLNCYLLHLTGTRYCG